MLVQIVAVDLRHDKRHVRLHSERRAVVYGYRAVPRGKRRKLAADGGGCGDEREVNLAEQLRRSHLDGYLLAANLQLLADGAFRRAQSDPLSRKLPLLDDLQEDLPNRARSAHDSYAALVHLRLP